MTKYEVMIPFLSSELGSSQTRVNEEELFSATRILRGDPVGTEE